MIEHFKGTGIIFLDNNDFNQNTLVGSDGKPVSGNWVCMVQGSFCGFCTKAKPDFVNAKNMVGNAATFCTIKIDGDASEKALGNNLTNIIGQKMSGVPAFVLFKNGKAISVHGGGRDSNSLAAFARS
jgi:hypothetical protein